MYQCIGGFTCAANVLIATCTEVAMSVVCVIISPQCITVVSWCHCNTMCHCLAHSGMPLMFQGYGEREHGGIEEEMNNKSSTSPHTKNDVPYLKQCLLSHYKQNINK